MNNNDAVEAVYAVLEAVSNHAELTETEIEADYQARTSRGHVLRARLVEDDHYLYGTATAHAGPYTPGIGGGGYTVQWDDGYADPDFTRWSETAGAYSIELLEAPEGATW